MATQGPKRSSSHSKPSLASKAKDNRALMGAAATVAALLKQPEVREQLIEASQNIRDRLRERSQARSQQRASQSSDMKAIGLPSRPGVGRIAVTPQQRLERRVDRLESTVALLRANAQPGTTEPLDQIDSVIKQVRLSLVVARNLPARPKFSSQREISGALTKVEKALVNATGIGDIAGDSNDS